MSECDFFLNETSATSVETNLPDEMPETLGIDVEVFYKEYFNELHASCYSSSTYSFDKDRPITEEILNELSSQCKEVQKRRSIGINTLSTDILYYYISALIHVNIDSEHSNMYNAHTGKRSNVFDIRKLASVMWGSIIKSQHSNTLELHLQQLLDTIKCEEINQHSAYIAHIHPSGLITVTGNGPPSELNYLIDNCLFPYVSMAHNQLQLMQLRDELSGVSTLDFNATQKDPTSPVENTQLPLLCVKCRRVNSVRCIMHFQPEKSTSGKLKSNVSLHRAISFMQLLSGSDGHCKLHLPPLEMHWGLPFPLLQPLVQPQLGGGNDVGHSVVFTIAFTPTTERERKDQDSVLSQLHNTHMHVKVKVELFHTGNIRINVNYGRDMDRIPCNVLTQYVLHFILNPTIAHAAITRDASQALGALQV